MTAREVFERAGLTCGPDLERSVTDLAHALGRPEEYVADVIVQAVRGEQVRFCNLPIGGAS